MVRRWAVTFTALTLLAPAGAYALGLGDINVRSGLNQALHAEIELLAVRPGELGSLSVSLASSEAFAQAGVERPFLLTQLRFKVEQHADGTPYIKVYTQEPIKEPYLNYLVEVNWSAGHLLREYTVLLDPPTLMAAPAPVIEAPAAHSSAPDSAPATGADDAAPASPAVPDVPAASDEYGPIRPGQGLWGVATRLRPDESVSVQQMMLALLKANPDAFLDPDNVNTLKADHMLRVPGPDEINALTPEQAIAVIKKHNAQWYKLHPAPVPTAAPAPAPTTPADASAPPEAIPEDGATGGKLKLVVPTDGQTPDAAPQAGTGADAEKANEALALANEELESKRQENDELRERVAELEKQTADIQRLMMLKNEELAALQGKLTAAPNAAQPAATAPTPAQSPAVSELNTGTLDQARAVARDVAEAIRTNPLAQGMVAVVALLLLSLLWVINRRRRVNAELIEEGDVSAMPLAVVPVAAAGVSTHAAPAHETDLLAEADVFMAYERYPEAEARLRQLLAQQPARADVHLKLLEIYHVTHDKSAFVAQAEALHRLVEGSGPEWTKAARLGTELCPEHHLFRADSDRTVTPNEAAAFTASAVAPAVSEPAPSLPDAVEFTPTAQDPPPLEFTPRESIPRESIQDDPPASALDLGALDYPGSAPSAPAASDEPQESAQTLALEDDLADFNLADIQRELEAGLAQQSADAPPQTADNGLTHELRLDAADGQEPDEATAPKLDFDLEHEAGMLADQTPEALHSPPALDDMLDLDASFLTNTDEVGTKLDLARAYIEMGDQEGAHSILDEVMKEGNEGQRQQAQELMVQVG